MQNILLFLLILAPLSCGPLYNQGKGNDGDGQNRSQNPQAPNTQSNSEPIKPGTPRTSSAIENACLEVESAYPGISSKTSFISEEDLKKSFLEAHNKVRKIYGLKPLIWSDEIARYSQNWAYHLRDKEDCKMIHRSGAAKEKKYGENLAYGAISTKVAMSFYLRSPEEISLSWSRECRDYNYETNECDPNPAKQCGHFTQVIWNSTERMGCAVATCKTEQKHKEIWVCNYDPSGNMTWIINGVPNKLKPF